MRRSINILLVGIFCIGLSGCYESVVRFWNGPGWDFSSEAEKKARKECFEELRSLPRPKNEYIGSKEMQDWLGNVYGPAERECMKRKGF
ncbi:hypothetical protein [Snodgrassella alvi]|jgi:hypothetical protein|uniref:hypothetical protein n=1 Tax=Snodgrassella alvi TaxID=1196083 RepID=UPI000C1E9392|nr:hypothetical protein [Snodgrassella alvi]PIT47503.1 hypothetical protein BHC51_05265 [Snodgrassella alvi]